MAIDDERVVDALMRNDFLTFGERVFREVNPGREFHVGWHHETIAYFAARAAAVAPTLRQIAADGIVGARETATELNRRGVPAPSGRACWSEQAVRRARAVIGLEAMA